MRIALLQLDLRWMDRPGNIEKIRKTIKDAAPERADIFVLPEMCTTGFTMDIKAAGNGLEEEKAFSLLASEESVNIIAGYAARRPEDEKGSNLAAAFDRAGRKIAHYEKMHPFTPLKEDVYYAAGERPVVFSLDGVPASVFICYDLRFPEAMRRVAKDVSIMFFIANWPSLRAAHWSALLRARAIENQCFVVGVNRVGSDGNGLGYGGGSAVFGPSGEEMLSGWDWEGALFCDIDPEEVGKNRAQYPFLKDMRPW